MPAAVNQIDRLTARQRPLLVGRGSASAATRFEMIAEGLAEAAMVAAAVSTGQLQTSGPTERKKDK